MAIKLEIRKNSFSYVFLERSRTIWILDLRNSNDMKGKNDILEKK